MVRIIGNPEKVGRTAEDITGSRDRFENATVNLDRQGTFTKVDAGVEVELNINTNYFDLKLYDDMQAFLISERICLSTDRQYDVLAAKKALDAELIEPGAACLTFSSYSDITSPFSNMPKDLYGLKYEDFIEAIGNIFPDERHRIEPKEYPQAMGFVAMAASGMITSLTRFHQVDLPDLNTLMTIERKHTGKNTFIGKSTLLEKENVPQGISKQFILDAGVPNQDKLVIPFSSVRGLFPEKGLVADMLAKQYLGKELPDIFASVDFSFFDLNHTSGYSAEGFSLASEQAFDLGGAMRSINPDFISITLPPQVEFTSFSQQQLRQLVREFINGMGLPIIR